MFHSLWRNFLVQPLVQETALRRQDGACVSFFLSPSGFERPSFRIAIHLFAVLIMQRLVLFLKIVFPGLLLYSLYYLVMHFYLYPLGSPKIARARASYDHAGLYRNAEVDYVILGDSTALYGLEPRKLSSRSVSFSMIASSLYSEYALLQKTEGMKIKKGIILTQTFISDHYNDSVWGISVPLGHFHFQDILTLFCDEQKSACSFYEKAELLTKYILAKGYLTTFAVQLLSDRLENYERSYGHLYQTFFDVTVKTRGFFEKTGIGENTPGQFLAPYGHHFSHALGPVPPGEIRHFQKLIELASKKNAKIFFVIMPFANGGKASAEAYRKSVKSLLLKRSAPPLKIIDLSVMESRLTAGDFWDYAHLNAEGARKVTLWLRKELLP